AGLGLRDESVRVLALDEGLLHPTAGQAGSFLLVGVVDRAALFGLVGGGDGGGFGAEDVGGAGGGGIRAARRARRRGRTAGGEHEGEDERHGRGGSDGQARTAGGSGLGWGGEAFLVLSIHVVVQTRVS